MIIWSTVTRVENWEIDHEVQVQSRVGGRRSAAERSTRGQYISVSMEDGVVLLEEPGQWHEQRGGTADKDVSDRKKAADGCGIAREKKQPSRRWKRSQGLEAGLDISRN